MGGTVVWWSALSPQNKKDLHTFIVFIAGFIICLALPDLLPWRKDTPLRYIIAWAWLFLLLKIRLFPDVVKQYQIVPGWPLKSSKFIRSFTRTPGSWLKSPLCFSTFHSCSRQKSFKICYSRPWLLRPVGFLCNNSCYRSTDYFSLLSASPTDNEKLACHCHWAMHFNEALVNTPALPAL